jgi:hypothetical protein
MVINQRREEKEILLLYRDSGRLSLKSLQGLIIELLPAVFMPG